MTDGSYKTGSEETKQDQTSSETFWGGGVLLFVTAAIFILCLEGRQSFFLSPF